MPNKSSRQFITPDGANARSLTVMLEFAKMPRIDLYEADAEDLLKSHCNAYLGICQTQDYRPSRESFAVSLHIQASTLTKLIHGTLGGRPLPRGVQEQLIEMDNIFQALTADGMLNGETNTIGSIFELKNNWGYKDQTEVITVRKNDALTGEELKALADSLPDVIDGEYHEVHQIGIMHEEKEN